MASEVQQEIESLLPHREPFLFVEDILEFESNVRIVTSWDVREDHDFFRGHYPGQPLLPGVLISEFAFQSGALLLRKSTELGWDGDAAGTPVLATIEKARFKNMVKPGTRIQAEVVIDRGLANARYMSGKITSPDGLVARLKFVLALANGEGAGA